MSKHISSKTREARKKKRHTAIVKYVSTCSNQGQYCVTVWCHRRKYRCNAYQKKQPATAHTVVSCTQLKRYKTKRVTWKEHRNRIECKHRATQKESKVILSQQNIYLTLCSFTSCRSSSSSSLVCALLTFFLCMQQTHIQWPRCLSR